MRALEGEWFVTGEWLYRIFLVTSRGGRGSEESNNSIGALNTLMLPRAKQSRRWYEPKNRKLEVSC
jgi:hypothetical protein